MSLPREAPERKLLGRAARGGDGPDFTGVREPRRLEELIGKIRDSRPQDSYVPPEDYVALTMANPKQGLVIWRVRTEQEGRTDDVLGTGWRTRRLIARLYDAASPDANEDSARGARDYFLDADAGERLLDLEAAGKAEIAEIGFLLEGGTYYPMVRSQVVQFPAGEAESESLAPVSETTVGQAVERSISSCTEETWLSSDDGQESDIPGPSEARV